MLTVKTIFFTFIKSGAAEALTLYTVKFRLGYCGTDEEVKALTLVAIGAAESFWVLFSEKSALSWPLKRPESLQRKCLNYFVITKNVML